MRRLCIAMCMAVGVLATSAPARASLRFAPCPGTPDFECGTLPVPLDPSGTEPGTVSLAVRRVVESRAAPEVLVALGGGPGQSATRFLEDFTDVLAEAQENRQLVVLDQRGTGDSGALRCAALDAAGATLGLGALTHRVGLCGAQLGASRRYYTTTQVVEDLEALRKELGVARISIFGISYGAYVAQRYARRYPGAVDRLVLDSPVSQEQGGAFDVSSYAAVQKMLRRECAGGRCRGVTADPVADVRTLAGRLRQRPLRGTVYDARGRAHVTQLGSEAQLFDLLVSSDFSPPLRAALPAAIRAAVLGDPAPLLRLVALDTGSADPHAFDEGNEDPREFSNALYFATTCEEKPLPWGGPDAPLDTRAARREAALDAGAFAPFGALAAGSTQVGTAFCREWPQTLVDPPPAPGPIGAPALILSGALDLRTPPAEATATARWIGDASLVRVPDAGHSLVSNRFGCVTEAMTRFFAGDAVGNPCAEGATDETPVAPLPPRRATVFATVADAAHMLAASGVLDRPTTIGGLRGGSVCAHPGDGSVELRFHRYAYVKGHPLSGAVTIVADRIMSLRGHPRVTHITVQPVSARRCR